MYSDEDGAATKHSQAVYNARMRVLLTVTSALSWLGFAGAVLNGEYARDSLHLAFSLRRLSWTRFLWPVLSFYSLSSHWKVNPISVYNAGVRGSLLSTVIASATLLAKGLHNGSSCSELSWVSLQFSTAALLAVVQLLFPRRPDLFTPEGKPVDLEGSSSAIRHYSMHWCTTSLVLAGNSAALDELPIIDYATRSKSQSLLRLASPGVSLWNRIRAERFLGFAKQWALMFVRSIVMFGSPYCIRRLLKSLEDNSGRTGGAWIWLVGIAASSLCQTIINYHLVWIQWSEMGIPIRAQLIMSIFQKALRRKDAKDQKKSSDSPNAASDKPEAVSLVVSDTLSFSRFTAVNYIIPSSFVRFIFAVCFLLNLLGWQSTFVGMVVTLLCVPIHTLVIKQQRAAKKSLTAARDKKTKVVTEAIHALRQIKFSALEDQWESHIETFRQEELKHLRWVLIINNLKSIWGVAAPSLVAASSICMYALLKGALTPSVMFPMIEVLPHLEATLGFVPFVLQDYFAARTNANRMEGFLRRPEQKTVLGHSPSGRVSFRDASIAWPSDELGGEHGQEKTVAPSHRFFLHGINLEFPLGELSVISGKTGAGKSLLLAAIIGEVELLSGHINAPSSAEGHPVAYVSQMPWLQNTTIKENILFGSAFDKERYEKVIQACSLQPDLKVLPKGDETQIGQRGVKLSGGQRARLAFGRALYSNARLLVLDDIFSALDSHVSKDIFDALTGDLGKGRTRILVTHHVSLCLPKAAYIVHVSGNTIHHAGNTEFIGKEVEAIEAEVQSTLISPKEEELQVTVDASDKISSKKLTAKKPTAKKAKKPNARSDLNVYKNYFAAAGGVVFTIIFLLGLVSIQVSNALTKWLLGRTNSARPEQSSVHSEKDLPSIANAGSEMKQYLYLYLWSSFLAIALQFLFNMHTSSGSLRASSFLFRKMTFKIIRMPILWLDSTPIGEMLKGFTLNTRLVDDLVLSTISEFADYFIKLLTVVSVGLYTSKYTSFLTVGLLFWCAQVSKNYIKARPVLKIAERLSTSDILEHFVSTVGGVSTIRAFGATDRSVEQMHQHLDRLSTSRRYFWIFNRWIGLQMSFIGIVFTIGTGVILLLSKSIIDPSLVGFSLTFSMGLSQAMFRAVNEFGTLESFMSAAGEVIEYTELETEDQGGLEVPEDWPSKGEVEISGLQVAYSADLPLVLKDFSLHIGSGQRIGIVGRTGAGKSSLTLALLRLLQPQAGSIRIDSIDISTIKLKHLRSRIAFLPQDPVLFSGTVRSNLDYFDQIPENKLKDALRRVKLLAEEAEGDVGLFTLDSQISAGGENMSQGQRQLLCLARLLLKDPKIIILDEATSAVDNKTDLLIQETIRTRFSGTLLVVAHRLRTVAQFDRVLVMSDGKAAEFGTPGDLLRDKGLFFDLVQDSQDREFLMSRILD